MAEAGLSEADKLPTSYNADDDAYLIKDTGIEQKSPVGFSDAFTFSTEGQFGFHAAGTSPTSGRRSITHPKGRAYTTNPTPPILFSISAQGQDSRSFDTGIWRKPGTMLLKIRYAQYGDNPPSATYLILITSKEYRIFGKISRTTDSIPLWAATYDYVANKTTPENTYNLGTMFGGHPNTLVSIKLGAGYKPQGTWESPSIALGSLDKVTRSSITWESQVPEGTALQMEARTSGGWVILNQGDPIPNLSVNKPMKDLEVFLRATLETANPDYSPKLTKIRMQVVGELPPVELDLFIDPLQRFHNNEGPILVTYEQNLGHLVGEGGSVESFSIEFEPVALIPKPNPGTVARVRGKVNITMNLLGIKYGAAYGGNKSRARAQATVKIELVPVGIVNP